MCVYECESVLCVLVWCVYACVCMSVCVCVCCVRVCVLL